MDEKLSICLLGPKSGGKSSLLASLTECVGQGAFGYSARLRPTLQSITEVEFRKGLIDRRKADFLTAPQTGYERLKQDLINGGIATNTLDTYEYYFRLTAHEGAQDAPASSRACLLEIIDASGDVALPSDEARVAILDDVKAKLARQIFKSEAIVIVLPMVRIEESGWPGALARLIDRLTLTRDKNLRRIVVVFSHYERLFTRLGPDAFTYACDPAVARYALQRALRASRWFDHLRKLQSDSQIITARFCVCSSYGFTKRFQNPNIDPWQAGDKLFHRKGLEGLSAFSEYWRPFLTAEPILYAALGVDSAFTFSFEQLDAHA